MFNSFFKKYGQQDIESLPEIRKSKIRNNILSRVEAHNDTIKTRKHFILKPAFITAAAVSVIAAAAVTAGALASPPETRLNGETVEPYYNVYQDEDGTMIEILAIKFPEELLEEEKPGLTPVGELRLDRSGIEPILVDEKGNTFTNRVNNMLVQIKETYLDGGTNTRTLAVANKIRTNQSYSFWGNGELTLFLSHSTVINGVETKPWFNTYYDPYLKGDVEITAFELPLDTVGETVPGCNFTTAMTSDPISEVQLKAFDENGNRIDPILTSTGGIEYPEGVNNLLVEVIVNYDDGTVEKFRFDPANKLEDFDYSAIEFDYSVVKYKNVF